MGRVAELARKLGFAPDRLPRDVVAGIALIPPVGAGIAIFGLPAAYDLGIGAGAGLVVHLALRLFRRRPAASPVVVAVAGVALVGPGAQLWWAAVVAGAACLLELVRTLLPGKPLPFHSGLWAYAAVYLSGRGTLAVYLAPGRTTRPFLEPIRLWHDFCGGAASPIDSVTLYVGNVAGPVFATSLLAIAVGAAWLWYARRLDLVALIGVACGALTAAIVEGWNPAFQVLCGPLWFTAVFCFADRRLLAGAPLLGGLIALAAAFAGVGLRSRGLSVEASIVAFAAAQLAVVIVVALAQLVRAGAPQTAVRRSIRLGRSPAGGQPK